MARSPITVRVQLPSRVGAPPGPRAAGGYRSGFCGGAMIHGVYITNAERLHRLCTFPPGGACTCPCHDGIAIWSERAPLLAAARTAGAAPGRRVASPAS